MLISINHYLSTSCKEVGKRRFVHMSDKIHISEEERKQQICWYVISTNHEEELKQYLDLQENIIETYLPVVQREKMQEGVLKSRLFLRNYLFVRSSYYGITRHLKGRWMLEYNTLKGHREERMVPNDQMQQFRWACDMNLKVQYLRNPYSRFYNEDRVRVLSGPYKGKEGFVTVVGKDHKLVLRIGCFAFALGDLNKYRYVVIANKNDRTFDNEATRMARLVDFFETEIADITNLKPDEIPEFLQEIVQDMHRYSGSSVPFSHLHKAYVSIITKLEEKEGQGTALSPLEEQVVCRSKTKCDYINHLWREEDRSSADMLIMMVGYIYSKEKNPLLDHYIPGHPLRPFLTPVYKKELLPSGFRKIKCRHFTQWTFVTNISEGIYDQEKDKTRMVSSPYQAHVGEFAIGDHIVMLANWTAFYHDFSYESAEEKETFRSRLEKKGCTCFLSSMFDKASDIRFLQLQEHGIAGLALTLPLTVAEEEKEQAVVRLTEHGKRIIKEIRSVQGMRKGQTALGTVWIRK